MSMYNSIEYSNNYSKTSGIMYQYCRYQLALSGDGEIDAFTAANAITYSFKIKEKITNETGDDGTNNVEIMVLLKYLSNLWGTLEMTLINCKINLDLNWSEKSVIMATNVSNQRATFLITVTKLYVLVVALSAQDNMKLFEQLTSGFKLTINRNKYQSKEPIDRPNQYLDYLIDPNFQGVDRLFVLSFEDEVQRSYKRYLPILEIKDYNVMIDGQNFFDQSVKNNLRANYSIRKIATGQGDY